MNELFEEQHQFLLTSQSDSYNERYENIEQKKNEHQLWQINGGGNYWMYEKFK